MPEGGSTPRKTNSGFRLVRYRHTDGQVYPARAWYLLCPEQITSFMFRHCDRPLTLVA
jgi:hypothetical protein